MLFSRQRPDRSADKLKPLTDPIKASEITAGMTNQHVITHASLGDSGEAIRHHTEFSRRGEVTSDGAQ